MLQAIKKDDRKAFDALMEKAQCGAYRLGRFPVLSLLYLYGARAVLSAYEQSFLQIGEYKVLHEPAEISRKFSAKAGKCLRLYFNEVVSPLEMLLILDKTRRLRRVYPRAKASEAVKHRLQSIYSIKYALGVRFAGENIELDRRPLTHREKNILIALCACLVLLISIPVTVVSVIYQPARGISGIDFTSTDEYTLKRNIVLPKNYTIEKINCKIVGNGHKIILRKGATLGELNGSLSDVTVESAGDTVFSAIAAGATVENVTVNVTADRKTSESGAFVAVNNSGTIDNVTVNVKGKLTAIAPAGEGAELTFGGIVLNNMYTYDADTKTENGFIKNCTVRYKKLTLSGQVGANAVFGGVAGTNNSYVQDCTVDGEISADTFDLAGVCAVNSGVLSRTANKANLSQVCADTQWNPIVCGIVLTNAYIVEQCENSGRISAISVCGQHEEQASDNSTVTAAGIAYVSRGSNANTAIMHCTNTGDIESRAAHRNAYAAGVCMSSSNKIEYCKNSGAVTVQSDNGYGTYGGGITTLAYGYIYRSRNEGDVTATGNGTAYAGGISAHARAQFLECVSRGKIAVTASNICAGGIFGFSETDVVNNIVNYSVLKGTADYCIAQNTIDVRVLGDTPAYVGGIAGYVRETGFRNPYNNSVTYYGGGVTNSYFVGECTSSVTHYGNIVGACGVNIYESNASNFKDNYYVENTLPALGVTVTTDGKAVGASDKGATAATLAEIQDAEGYKGILNALEE